MIINTTIAVLEYMCNKENCNKKHRTAVYVDNNELLVVADERVLYEAVDISKRSFEILCLYLAMIIEVKLSATRRSVVKVFYEKHAWEITLEWFPGKIDGEHLAQFLGKVLGTHKSNRFSMAGCNVTYKVIHEAMPIVGRPSRDKLVDARSLNPKLTRDAEVIMQIMEKWELAVRIKE